MTTQTNFPELLQDQAALTKALAGAQGGVIKGFLGMKEASIVDGALAAKTKETIALVIGVVTQCDYCIAYHANECVKLGATREEVAEALGVTVFMGGGPKFNYAARALAAYDQFAKAAA